jgi:prophage antirepressor-like protein
LKRTIVIKEINLLDGETWFVGADYCMIIPFDPPDKTTDDKKDKNMDSNVGSKKGMSEIDRADILDAADVTSGAGSSSA